MADERSPEMGGLHGPGFAMHWQASYETDSKGLMKPNIKVDIYASYPDGITEEALVLREAVRNAAIAEMHTLLEMALTKTDQAIWLMTQKRGA